MGTLTENQVYAIGAFMFVIGSYCGWQFAQAWNNWKAATKIVKSWKEGH